MKLWGKIVLGNYDNKGKVGGGGHHSQINEIKFEKGTGGYLVL